MKDEPRTGERFQVTKNDRAGAETGLQHKHTTEFDSSSVSAPFLTLLCYLIVFTCFGFVGEVDFCALVLGPWSSLYFLSHLFQSFFG